MAEPQNLHEIAVKAEQNLEQLATGLAKAGAPEEAVSTVTKMAEVTRKIITALGKGQEETGDNEPAPPPEEAPEATPERRETMDSATASLHEEAQRRAAQSQGG